MDAIGDKYIVYYCSVNKMAKRYQFCINFGSPHSSYSEYVMIYSESGTTYSVLHENMARATAVTLARVLNVDRKTELDLR
jgi:hypothetical protein